MLVDRRRDLFAGLNATDVISALNKAHADGQKNAGLDIETGEPRNLAADDITDLHSVKWCALSFMSTPGGCIWCHTK